MEEEENVGDHQESIENINEEMKTQREPIENVNEALREQREREFWALYNDEAFRQLPDEERQFLLNALLSMKETYLENPQLASKVVNYLVRQINRDTLHAHLGYAEYRTCLRNAVEGLFVLLFIDEYTPNISLREPVFRSLVNAFINYYSMLFKGNYNAHLERLAAAKSSGKTSSDLPPYVQR